MSTPQTWRSRIVGHGEKPAGEFLANPANWRVHPKAQRDALKGVLSEVGWVTGVVENVRTGHLIDGHARVEEALKLGDETPVPYVQVDLSEDEERTVLATLDPISAMAAADKEQLDTLLQGVQTGEAAVQAMLGELAKDAGLDYGKGEPVDADEDAAEQIDKAAELQKKWGTAANQLWAFGDHRLLCGDSTSAHDHARLLMGDAVDAVVTDPPYGVGVDYGSFEDTLENVKALMAKVLPLILKYPSVALTPGVPSMWLYPQPAWLMVWVHPAPSGSCPWGFAGVNPILVYGKDPYLSAGLGRRPDSVVMASDRQGETGHPTPKPLKVWTWLVERMTPKPGQIVLDTFGGSGTTGVACQSLGRKARMIELDPGYCAVILERMSGLGLTPERVGG